jgi:hypothetical protein
MQMRRLPRSMCRRRRKNQKKKKKQARKCYTRDGLVETLAHLLVAQVVGERDNEALDGDKQHQDAQGHEGKAHDRAGLEGDLKGRANATDSRLGDAAVGVYSDAHANEAGQDRGTRAQNEGGLTRRKKKDSTLVNTTR